MHVNKNAELRQIQRNLLITIIIDTPGTILVGLGLYGVFGADGDAFLNILNDQNIAYGAIVLGGAIMIWSFVRVLSLLQKKAKIMREASA
jgi:hypothetical protein